MRIERSQSSCTLAFNLKSDLGPITSASILQILYVKSTAIPLDDFIITNSKTWLAVLITVIKAFWQELEMVSLLKQAYLVHFYHPFYLINTLIHTQYAWDEHI